MMSFLRFLSVIGLFFILFSSHNGFSQSGWVRAKGEVFASVGLQHFSSKNYINLSGEALTTSTFSQQTLQFYGEYGLSEKWTIIMNVPLLKSHGFETTKRVFGTGDLRLELKYPLISGKWNVAVSVAPEIPIAPGDNFAQNKINAFDFINLPTGDGEFNVWNTLAISKSHSKKPLYASVFVAYNIRTGYQGASFNDQLQEGLEVGYKIKGKMWLQGRWVNQQTLGSQSGFVGFIRGEGSEYSMATVALSYDLNPKWALFGKFNHVISFPTTSKNIYAGGIFNLGVMLNKKPNN